MCTNFLASKSDNQAQNQLIIVGFAQFLTIFLGIKGPLRKNKRKNGQNNHIVSIFYARFWKIFRFPINCALISCKLVLSYDFSGFCSIFYWLVFYWLLFLVVSLCGWLLLMCSLCVCTYFNWWVLFVRLSLVLVVICSIYKRVFVDARNVCEYYAHTSYAHANYACAHNSCS